MSSANDLASKNRVVPIKAVEFVAASWTWPFAANRRAEIDRYFAQLRQLNPALWNGQVLLLRDFTLQDSVLRGTVFETDYASMVSAIDWQAMGDTIKACFGATALRTADDAFVVGVMAPHTRNAGQVYFPSGSMDPADLVGATVDFASSVERELLEETGLPPDDLEYRPGWYAVFAGPRLPIIKVAQARESGETLRQRILANLATQSGAEFSDIRLIRWPSDFDPKMPSWMKMFFEFVGESAGH